MAEAPTKPASRPRTWFFALVTIAIGLATGLGAAELLLRTVLPSYSPLVFDIFYRDAKGLLRMQPHVRRQHVAPEWNVTVETNSEGFRDSDKDPLPAQPAILALGDSLAFGWGVEYPDGYLTRVEAALGGPDRARVVKAAIPATGPTDQLPMLEELLGRVHPSTVLLSFFVGNDFTDAAEGGAAQFRVVDGLLLRSDDASERGLFGPARSWLKRRSHLAQWVAQRMWEYQARQAQLVPIEKRSHPGLDARDRWLHDFVEIHLAAPPSPQLQRGIERTRESLTAMDKLARDHGARFILLVVPRSIQIYDSDRRRYEEAFGIEPSAWDLDRPQRILEDWAARRGAEILDLLPALRAAASKEPRFYYFPDSHLNREGHRLVALEVERYLSAHAAPARE